MYEILYMNLEIDEKVAVNGGKEYVRRYGNKEDWEKLSEIKDLSHRKLSIASSLIFIS